jgi:hypothetical protein
MSEWKELARFLYGKGFWYADPVREIEGLSEAELFWVPSEYSLPIIWQVGHIAHRERYHIGRFLAREESELIPPRYEVFGTEWCPAEHLHKWVDPVDKVIEWVREVRAKSHEYIDSISEEDFTTVPKTSEDGLSVAHWLFITTNHTALHIGRIQALRAMVENKKERAC